MKLRSAKRKGNVCSSTIAGTCSRLRVDDGLVRKDGYVMHWCVLLAGDYTHVCRKAKGTAEHAYGLSALCHRPPTTLT